jgi:hypothetical protein
VTVDVLVNVVGGVAIVEVEVVNEATGIALDAVDE